MSKVMSENPSDPRNDRRDSLTRSGCPVLSPVASTAGEGRYMDRI
jgi:hypothetical protein